MTALTAFYQQLDEIREAFHKYGHFNDSNSKLDELSKFLAIYIDVLQKDKKAITLHKILDNYKKEKNFPLVEILKGLFKEALNNSLFKLSNNKSIFSESWD